MVSILQHERGQQGPALRVLRDEESPPYDGSTRRRHMTVLADDAIDRIGSDLGAVALAVYVALERRTGNEGTCWPSYQTLADAVGMSRRGVINTMAKLVEAKFVVVRKRTTDTGSPDSNEFYLPLHQMSEPSERPSERGGELDALPSERPSERPRARTRHGSEVVREVVGGADAPSQPMNGSGTPTKREHRIPADWEPSAAGMRKALERWPKQVIEAETEKFVDHFLGKAERRVDWEPSWRNWLRRAPEFAPRSAATQSRAGGQGRLVLD